MSMCELTLEMVPAAGVSSLEYGGRQTIAPILDRIARFFDLLWELYNHSNPKLTCSGYYSDKLELSVGASWIF